MQCLLRLLQPAAPPQRAGGGASPAASVSGAVTGASARLPGWLDRVDRLQGGPRAVMPSSEGGRPMTCTAAVRDSTVTGMISLFTELLYK